MHHTTRPATKRLFTFICTFVMFLGIFSIFGFKNTVANAANERSLIVGREGINTQINVPNANKATASAKFVKVTKSGNNGNFILQVSPMPQNAQLQRKADVSFTDTSGKILMILHIKQSWFSFSISTNMISLNKNAGAANNAKFTITSDRRYKLEYSSRYIIRNNEGKEILAGDVLGNGNNVTTTSFMIYPRVANNTGKNISSTITIKAVGNNEIVGTITVVQKG